MKNKIIVYTSIILFHSSICSAARLNTADISRGSEELSTAAQGLTLRHENLDFHADAPYSGSIHDWKSSRKYIEVIAGYNILSNSEQYVPLEFIATDPSNINIKINNEDVDIINISCKKNVTRLRSYNGRFNNSKCCIKFGGIFKNGYNSVSVSYKEPLSYLEITQNWVFGTMYNYNLFPLKNWKLSETFKLIIRVSFRDDTGIKRVITGSKYNIKLFAFENDKDMYEDYKTSNEIVANLKGKHLFSQYLFNSEFPDMIKIICTY